MKAALGKNFPYSSLILLSGERSLELEESIKGRKLLDSSSIPLMGRIFHSKIYLFEKPNEQIQLIVGSFNATSAGMSQNLEFWVKTQARINLKGFGVNNLADLLLDKKVKVDAIPWNDFCLEEEKQFIVAPAIDVLWRLVKNGVGLAPGKSRCLSDVKLKNLELKNYDSIFVHTLGNNSLSKTLELMIKESLTDSQWIKIRAVSPYHNIQGIEYLYKKCQDAIGKKPIHVEIELLTVFPPDFSEKFSDPKKQPFAPIDVINKLSLKDERIKVKLKLWKKETKLKLSELDEELTTNVQNIFLHGKAILVKSEQNCSFLLGSPNLTDSAFGAGPNVNFESAIWERNRDSASKMWSSFDLLFQVCAEAQKEDFEAFQSWASLFYKDPTCLIVDVRSSRDAISRFLNVSLKKGDQYLPLQPYEETCIYFDELNKASLSIVLKPGCPRLGQSANISFSPSNLEDTKEIDSRFEGAELISNLLVNTDNADNYYVRIGIESNLVEERRVKVTISDKAIQTAITNLLIFDQDSIEAFLVVETDAGPLELKCSFNGEYLKASKPPKIIPKTFALLRIYSKSEKTVNSFGYYVIKYRKREPKFILRIACIRPYPISVYFEEIENNLAARILPKSINFSILTNDSIEIPTSFVAARAISHYPFIQSLLLMPTTLDHERIRLEVSFVDENGGSYRQISKPQLIGYTEIKVKETSVFVPKNAAEGFLVGSCDRKEIVNIETSNDDYSKILLPRAPAFCDRDRHNIWFLSDPLPQFFVKTTASELKLFPKSGFIVSNAPIKIRLSLGDIDEPLKTRCSRINLSWFLRNFGQEEKGQNKSQGLDSLNEFELQISDLDELQKKLNDFSGQWKGYLDFYFWYIFAGQYYLRSRKNTVYLSNSQGFLDSIFKDLWTLPISKEKLLSDLTHALHPFFVC